MRIGKIAASDGRTLNDEPLAYSSETSHLVVDPTPSKEHLKIMEMNGGSLVSVNTSVQNEQEFIFYSQEHHLDIIPRVSVRFYVRQVPAAMSGFEGQYSSYLYIGGIPFYESIFFRVTKTHIYFIHKVGAIFVSPTQYYDSIMQDTLFRIKLTVFQNEGLDEPYDSILQT
jgi:hypothetical protein